ncbi:MAG: 50S ribosomal protein L22 [Candidatus Glassbacteria bacterium RBG_16_58_8]|uniref:Large ribosomal subunit protein uL22 n=1 Tax=Candidatus Glassbacteria bacterium RBG_16_58_8 TaxID=1817866 RepID=A0A1F5Y9Z6_9BACT|nr:ribosomal protein L22 [uncultured bacterium]OGF97058.1 MAG: 50S ribosomal protein L22 [Candidatus Glassbacteria bacterium RBG_16_58_8]
MEGKAISRYVRSSPRRARLVADLVRGLPVEEAYAVLQYCRKRAATPVLKTLRSAVSNALSSAGTLQLRVEDLRIAELRIDEGPSLKRFRAMSMGRVGRVRRRTSHITVVVTSATGRV